jgi:TolA-binding protein
MAKKKKHRIRKHDLKHDQFIDSAMEFVSATRHNAPRIAISVIAVLVVLLIASYILNNRRRTSVEAEQVLSTATASFINGDFESARDALQELTTRYWGTRASREALFFLGNTYYALQDYDNALKNFEQFLTTRTRWPILKASATMGMANCHEQMQQFLIAAEGYERVVNVYPDSPLAPEALVAAARCYEALGQAPAAAPLYERLKRDYPDSPLRDLADVRLKLLTGAEQVLQ